MKAAQISDHRRTLRKSGGNWPVRIERFAFDGLPSIGSGEISFASAITFLSGPNGVGKTTLLRGIWAAISPADAQARAGSTRRLQSGKVVVGLVEHGSKHECITVMSSGVFSGNASHEVDVIHIDTADEVQRQQHIFETYTEIDNYTEDAGAYILTEEELIEVSFLARRDYKSATLYEVDSLGPTLPFFEVALHDNRYDSRTMGSGEVAAFFLWWVLRRASPRSILLIEEPETFLSPASQDALGAHLIAVGCKKRLCIVVTTHSPSMILPMSDDSLRFVVRDHRGVCAEIDAPSIVLTNLGISQSLEGVLLTEDDLGMEFGKALLEKFSPRVARRLDFCPRGGDGEVIESLRRMPNTRRLKVIGVLDGDVRGKAPEDVALRCIYLPGDDAIEIQFKRMVMNDPKSLEELLDSSRVPAILGSLGGRDHHDWFRDLAHELGYERNQLFSFMLTLWLRSSENVNLAKTYVESIRAALDAQVAGGPLTA